MSFLNFNKTETSSFIICIDVKPYTTLKVFSVQAKNKIGYYETITYHDTLVSKDLSFTKSLKIALIPFGNKKPRKIFGQIIHGGEDKKTNIGLRESYTNFDITSIKKKET